MKLKPIRDNIIIEPIPDETIHKTQSGLLLPIHSKMSHLVRNIHSNRGIVRAIGKGIYFEDCGFWAPFEVKIGDEVVYSRWGATKVIVDDKEYLLLSIKDVEARIE